MLTNLDTTIMVFAYRYAVEHYMSYTLEPVCDYIIDKIPEMTDQQITTLKNEVKYALENNKYTDDIAFSKANKLFQRLLHGNIHVDDWFYDIAGGEQVWARVVHNNRYCYWGCETKDVFPDSQDFYDGCEQGNKLLLDKIIRDSFDPAKLPRIEDASPAMQYLWHNITDSDNCMWFVDNDEFEFSSYYEDLKLTKEEFQKQVDADIKKYHLEDVITKYEDATAMYTCYGDLQAKFSGRVEL